MIHYKDTDLAYIAGIIDGEGTIGVTRVKRPENRCGYCFNPVFSITHTDYKLLEFINNTFNGVSSIIKHNGGNRSGLTQNKQCYRIFSKRAEKTKKVVEAILPYLRVKRENAENLLKLLKIKEKSKNYTNSDVLKEQFDIYIKARQLNGAELDSEDVLRLTPDWSKMDGHNT